jgi:signal transduction histidine kinase/CheY-like chemotaxis protein
VQLDAERLQAQLLGLALRNAVSSYVVATFNAFIVVYMVWDFAPHGVVLAWVAALLGLNTLRLALTQYYTGREWPARSIRPWSRMLGTGTVLSAAMWGVAIWLFAPIDSPVVRAYVTLVTAGVTSGGAAALAPLRGVALAWIFCVVTPLWLQCIRLGDGGWALFGWACLPFAAHYVVVVLNAHRRIVDGLRLADSLVQSKVEVEAARDEALRAAQAKSAFLANMSHEIRTPMTAILGYADLLHEEASSPAQRSYTQSIQRGGRHLLVLINDILDLSKIDAGKMALERIPCDPAQVIASALDMVAERARTAGLELRRELREPFPRVLLSDPVRLQQILVNLLANAIKFTETGEVRVEAFAERKQGEHRQGDGARFCVRVHDTGIGMTAEQLDAVFRPFTQADATISRRYGGTGLGLSISQRLALLLGGSLTAKSEPGRGSCFELSLDIGAWDELELGPASVADAVARVEPRARRFRGRVLVAEDGPDNRALLTILLERRGLAVDAVENGRDAVECAMAAWRAGTPHDLVLMDVQMPHLDGLAATQRLKARAYPAPIVALTAQAMEGDRATCLSAGCDDYETKPIPPQQLDRLLARYLEPDPENAR